MGHCIDYLSFDYKTDRKKIQAECDKWGDHNCDLGERGWQLGIGLGSAIRFKESAGVFEDYDAAVEYLDRTCDAYDQVAVKYRKYPPNKKTKAVEELERRADEYRKRLRELEKPHYQGVKQATVKCKACGSSLATAYCGRTYYNKCPVCHAELRPQSVLDRKAQCEDALKGIEAKIKAEEKKQRQKEKAQVFWLVHCEVHC